MPKVKVRKPLVKRIKKSIAAKKGGARSVEAFVDKAVRSALGGPRKAKSKPRKAARRAKSAAKPTGPTSSPT